jgi:O-antigen ligase
MKNLGDKNYVASVLIAISFLTLFGPIHFNSMSLIGLGLYSIYFLVKGNRPSKTLFRKGNLDLILMLILFFVYAISLTYSENKSKGLADIIRIGMLLVLPLIYQYLPDDVCSIKIRKLFVFSTAAVLLVLFGYGIIQNLNNGNDIFLFFQNKLLHFFGVLTTGSMGQFNFWRFTYEGLTQLIDIHPIYVSLFLNLAFVFLISLKEIGQVKNWVFWVLSLYFLAFSILLSSRTGTLVFLVLMVIYFLVIKVKTKQDFLKGIGTMLVLGLFAILFAWQNPIVRYRIISVFNTEYQQEGIQFSNQTVRFSIWSNVIQLIEKEPIFGYGIGDSQDELLNQYINNDFVIGVEHNFNCHNQYLQISLDIGLIGLLVFLGVLYFGLFGPSKNNVESKLIYVVFIISIITESMFSRHLGLTSFMVFLMFSNKYPVKKNEKYEV